MKTNDRIRTLCPSCGFDSVYIGDDGYLVCGHIGCFSPCVDTTIANLRAERDKLQALLTTPDVVALARAIVTLAERP
jgi:hypothetical protein